MGGEILSASDVVGPTCNLICVLVTRYYIVLNNIPCGIANWVISRNMFIIHSYLHTSDSIFGTVVPNTHNTQYIVDLISEPGVEGSILASVQIFM